MTTPISIAFFVLLIALFSIGFISYFGKTPAPCIIYVMSTTTPTTLVPVDYATWKAQGQTGYTVISDPNNCVIQ